LPFQVIAGDGVIAIVAEDSAKGERSPDGFASVVWRATAARLLHPASDGRDRGGHRLNAETPDGSLPPLAHVGN